MHMSDALVSPAVGGALWLSSLAIARQASRKMESRPVETLPLMGVAGAFVFAAQMINISIPGTGSSGHLGGGLLLASLVGPEAAFLIMFVVLFIQATFFADGGLLALGCNVINMGFFPIYIVYPYIRNSLASPGRGSRIKIIIAAVIGIELGATGVVIETALSGLASLNWKPFLAAFLPIHLAIGLLEGVLTVAILSFLYRIRPDIIPSYTKSGKTPSRIFVGIIFLLALGVAGLGSRFASTHPDGLEWSLVKGQFFQSSPSKLQEKTAPFPGYQTGPNQDSTSSWAGIIGILLTLGVLMGVRKVFIWRRKNLPPGNT
ncbi:MAG: cobalamin biosynthesis protein CbiM [FCB group bacterium]|nr:cobalamin biosynthesis protein CbiM [FCB group bacterium]